MSSKITIVGAGNVGATLAQRVAESGLAQGVLIDVVEGIPQGKGLDIWQTAPVCGFSHKITGTNDYAESAGSDIVVITAGIARKPGMSRDDLLATNAKIVASVTQQAAKYSPDCIFIVVTNPLDAMAYVVRQVSGFPRERVIGMAGVLDSARMCAFIADALQVSPECIQTLVLGGHGDTMVPLPRYTSVAGIPLMELMDVAQLEAIARRTRDGGAEIVGLLKTGSAYYAPSAAVWEMARAILLDQKKILPCAVYLDGEYGLRDIYMGVPVKLGRQGVEQIIELALTDSEKKQWQQSAHKVRETINQLKEIKGLFSV